jgi:hypothetical protein
MIFNICTISKSEIQKLVHIQKLFKFQICSKLNLFKIKFVQIQISYLQNLSNSNLFKLENCSKFDRKREILGQIGPAHLGTPAGIRL